MAQPSAVILVRSMRASATLSCFAAMKYGVFSVVGVALAGARMMFIAVVRSGPPAGEARFIKVQDRWFNGLPMGTLSNFEVLSPLGA